MNVEQDWNDEYKRNAVGHATKYEVIVCGYYYDFDKNS
jgi:hypothetical protein